MNVTTCSLFVCSLHKETTGQSHVSSHDFWVLTQNPPEALVSVVGTKSLINNNNNDKTVVTVMKIRVECVSEVSGSLGHCVRRHVELCHKPQRWLV